MECPMTFHCVSITFSLSHDFSHRSLHFVSPSDSIANSADSIANYHGWLGPRYQTVDSPNHIKFIKHVSGTGAHFSILWLHMCYQKNIYRKSKILHPSLATFGCNRSRIQPGFGSSLISWKRPRMHFVRSPPPMRNASVFHQERASYTGDLHGHELKTCHVGLISCCCFLHFTSTQAYSPDPVPENAAYCQELFLDASICYFVWSGNGSDIWQICW